MPKNSKSKQPAPLDAGATTNKKRKQSHTSPLLQEASKGENDNQRPKKHEEKRKSKQALKEEAEERRLTALLFGGEAPVEDPYNTNDPDLLQEQEDETPEAIEEEEEEGMPLFEIDRTGDNGAEKESLEEHSKFIVSKNPEDKAEELSDGSGEDDKSSEIDEEKPAWLDEDDDDVEVDLLSTNRLRKLRKSRAEDTTSQPLTGSDLEKRLRARYKSTMQAAARTGWARLDETPQTEDAYEEDGDEAAELQSSSQPLLGQGIGSSNRLPANILNVVRCPDANQADYNQAVVQAVNFHPTSNPERPLMLTAGLDKTLRFFHVGAEKSEKIHGIHFPKLPIFSASFLGNTGKVVVSGRRPFFYIYDSIAGKLDSVPRIVGREEKSLEKCFPSPDGRLIAFVGNDGYVILVDVQSKQWVANLKMNGSVRSIAFTPDGDYILASGSDGDVYRWELRTRKCVERFSNQDGTITSYLAASSRRHLAVGAESGVVNLYSDEVRMSTNRTPIKSIMNLQTSVDMLRFNHDGQILAMSSRREKDAMKLLHVPTATVFSNWPTSKTPFNYVWSMDFSPQSKFLAVGNDKGKCLLYQLLHYNQD